MNHLTINNLSITYSNGVRALDNISLDIPQGMFGLLGPNGAGKSSLMRTIATLQRPDQGELCLGNINVLEHPREIRKVLGYLPQQFGLYPKSTAEELLNHLAILKGLVGKNMRSEMVASLLQKTNLYDVRHQKLGGFSGGMKQRFGIAQALLTNPKLLLVDEPTAGLDPAERNRFYNILSELSEHTIVILSSHIVDDIRQLCSNMAIINKGKLLITGQPQELIEELNECVYKKRIHKSELDSYNEEYNVISNKLFQGQPEIRILSRTDPRNGFTAVEANLEDRYFSEMNASN